MGLGFESVAHRINDPNRKARIERPFRWVESGFLPGRHFASFDDLNAQALRWCIEVANAKPKRSLGMSPEAAYVMEKPHLASPPAVLPAVYDVFDRVVDLYAFVNVDVNRYSVPERLVGKTVTVYKHYATIEIHYRRMAVASHPRLASAGLRSASPMPATPPSRRPGCRCGEGVPHGGGDEDGERQPGRVVMWRGGW